MRYILEADYKKVAKEIERYLKWKKIPYEVKEYSRPRMVKFKLGFMKSIVIAQVRNSTFVKIPSAEFYDVIAEFKAKAVVGKILDREGTELELAILSAQEDAAKKTLILIVALTAFATPAMIIKKLPPYSLFLLLFSLVPVKVEERNYGLELKAYPILYPYYAFRRRKLEKMKESFSHSPQTQEQRSQ